MPQSSGLEEIRALGQERPLGVPSWGSHSRWPALSGREWELCGLRSLPLAVVTSPDASHTFL